jgi:CheY-like chemotaxis protein
MRPPGHTCNAPGVATSCLIVDDNVDYLQTARALLQQEGIDVVGVATNSAEALQRVSELRPSVALVDVYLGEESGLDLARQLADGPDGARPDVILISTYGERDFAELIDDSPAVAFVSKSDLSGNAVRDALGLRDDA